ncbi:hypothetical protein [Enterococcus rivorum]|uniref:Uncharacterized protein n=1 Tax=Enterococcus rivorum TaxID=762845 RepID=A0A1E5KTE0_9ENTE|nr:hypothetical protein [Enterococcus rivorum]MBP2100743.1 hypothetical protein [Enterococcus rivorum]OEH81130.1 hypothetical protein BCR26_17550 [Enterococcus rivorum]
MNNEKTSEFQTDNKQPIKKICYQDIYALHVLLEQLTSWNETLSLLEKFFSDEKRPVNKQQIVKNYYACSKVFSAFHGDFKKIITSMELQIEALRTTEKI